MVMKILKEVFFTPMKDRSNISDGTMYTTYQKLLILAEDDK